MGKCSAPRFKGKLKREIADEAFKVLGKDATVQQVDAFFRKRYGLGFCERTMYATARRKAQGKPIPVRRSYRRYREKNFLGVIVTLRELAVEVGSWEELEQLVKVLSDT